MKGDGYIIFIDIYYMRTLYLCLYRLPYFTMLCVRLYGMEKGSKYGSENETNTTDGEKPSPDNIIKPPLDIALPPEHFSYMTQ